MDDAPRTPEPDESGVFEQIAVDRVADAVVEQIESLIIAGVLKSGQRLPPERELAEQLGISRPKLREAFGVLVERGLVEIRRSEGAFVRTLSGPMLSPAIVGLFSRHRSAFLDFVEFRREQESFAAHLAAERATEADRDAIARLVAEMEAARSADDIAEESRLDLSFHTAIAEAAHNAMLLHVLTALLDLINRSVFQDREMLYREHGGGQRILDEHRGIAEAILARDATRAAEAAERHLSQIERGYRHSEDVDRRRSVARKRRLLAHADDRTRRRR